MYGVGGGEAECDHCKREGRQSIMGYLKRKDQYKVGEKHWRGRESVVNNGLWRKIILTDDGERERERERETHTGGGEGEGEGSIPSLEDNGSKDTETGEDRTRKRLRSNCVWPQEKGANHGMLVALAPWVPANSFHTADLRQTVGLRDGWEIDEIYNWMKANMRKMVRGEVVMPYVGAKGTIDSKQGN